MARPRLPLRSPRVVRLLGLAVIVAIAVAYVQPVRAYLDAKDDLARHRHERAALLHQQARLRARLEQAGTDEFVIREARLTGLVRPGERLFIVRGLKAWTGAQVP